MKIFNFLTLAYICSIASTFLPFCARSLKINSRWSTAKDLKKLRLFSAEEITEKVEQLQPLKTPSYEQVFDTISGFGTDYYKSQASGRNGQHRTSINSLGVAGTYGEVFQDSIRNIFYTQNIHLSKNDIFYDLGSGIGKIVALAAFETNCGRSVGIELGERRHSLSMEVLRQLQSSGHKKAYTIDFIKGDLLDIDWQSNVTCLYICCLCFPQEVFDKIERDILTSCPNLKYILLVGKQLQSGQEKYHHKQVLCPATWSDSEMCDVYIRKDN